VQWKESRPVYRHAEVINLVFQSIQSVVPQVADTQQKFAYKAQEPADRELAQILNDVAESDWARKNWSAIQYELLLDAHLYGTGISELGVEFENGLAEICYRTIDPFYFYPDPSAVDTNREGRYAITAIPRAVETIKSEYPDMANFISADLSDVMSNQRNELAPFRLRTGTDGRMPIEGPATKEPSIENTALFITCYLKSDEWFETEDQTPDGEKVFTQQLKYPRGRKIVMCNNVILEDEDAIFEDGLFPFQRLQNYTNPREFYGISEIEQLQGPQRTFNKLVSFTLDVLTLMGNPVWVIDSNSGIDPENIYNRPGLIVEKNPGAEVRRMEGVQLQPYVLQLIDNYKMWFDQIGGQQDVTRGVNPTGITAAAAIEALQQTAMTRVRQKNRNLTAYLQDLGQQYRSRVFQFYDAPRIVRLQGKDGAEKYFKFYMSGGENGAQRQANVIAYEPKGLTGNYQQTEPKSFGTDGEFDTEVIAGTALPFEQARQKQEALDLFKLGVLNAEELLERIDYPNRQKILERIKADQEQAAAQGAAGAPQGGPPPK
jgi:hypothetical protein